MIPGIVAGFRAIPDSFPVYSPTPFLLPEVKEVTYDWASSSGDTGATVAADASWDSADYVLFGMAFQGSSSVTLPSGVVLLGTQVHPTDSDLVLKVFGGFKGSASSFSFSWSGGAVFAMQAFALSNIDSSNPIHEIAFAGGTFGTTADIVPPTAVVVDTNGKYATTFVAGDQNFSQDIKRGTPVKVGGVWASIGGTTRRIRGGAHPVAEYQSEVVSPRWGCNLSTDAIAASVVLNRASGSRPSPIPDWESVDTYLGGFSVGYAWAALLNGEVVDSNASGWARAPGESIDPSVPFTLDTVAQIGSVSKIVTELALRKLADNGDIDLDNTAASYMGGGYAYGTNVNTITLRQLLLMTSGISASYPLLGAYPASLEAWVGNSATNPGGVYLYQNGNFAMLQSVIEAVTGEGYIDWVQANIFAPAGVTGAVATPPVNGAMAYAQGATTGVIQATIPTTGAAGWHMSVNNMLNISRQLRKPTVISESALAEMLDDRYRLSPQFNQRSEIHAHDGVIISGSRGFYAYMARLSDGYDFVAVTNTRPTSGDVSWTSVVNSVSNIT